jgi:hypothetical protein
MHPGCRQTTVLLMDTMVLLPGVKRPDREGDYKPPSSADVKNEWSYTCIAVNTNDMLL